MKQTYNNIMDSWTMNHKTLILALALLAAHVYPLIELPTVNAEPIVYERPPLIDTSIEMKLQERAKVLYKENENTDLEKYRLEAIRELNQELMGMIDNSPFVDYEAMANTYGY